MAIKMYCFSIHNTTRGRAQRIYHDEYIDHYPLIMNNLNNFIIENHYPVMFEENKNFWTSFINLYRARPCLWDVKSTEYTNKKLKSRAYGDLVEKCKEINSKADKHYVIKKINSLRASFRRQLRKIKDGVNSTENAAENVPEPTLWYYELMAFTLYEDEALPVIPSVTPQANAQVDEESKDVIFQERSDFPVNRSLDTAAPPQASSNARLRPETSDKRSGKDLTSWTSKRNKLADVVSECLKDEGSRPDNDCTAFGKSVGLELEMVRDREQNDIAKKLISDALFFAKRGKLTCDARIVVGTVGPNQQFRTPVAATNK